MVKVLCMYGLPVLDQPVFFVTSINTVPRDHHGMVHIVARTPDGAKHATRVKLKTKDKKAKVQHDLQ